MKFGRLTFAGAVASLSVAALVATQSPAVPHVVPQPQPSAGMMAMDEMMRDCQGMMSSIDQLIQLSEQARQSNDPAKMRAALDQTQRSLREMRNRMDMMRMMQGRSSPEPDQHHP